MSAVGRNISIKMKELGLSQNRLAKLSGVSQSNISSILSETKSPSIDTVQLIADARQLLADYEALSPQGREYIRQQMAMALKVYPGESVSLPNVEAE